MEKSELVKKLFPATVLVLGACAAPAAQYTPYPSAGTSAQQYTSDVADCRAWASSQSGASPQRGVNQGVQGAIGGAIVGALLGAILGNSGTVGQGALIGGVIGGGAGGLTGTRQAQVTYNIAYDDCLQKKGY